MATSGTIEQLAAVEERLAKALLYYEEGAWVAIRSGSIIAVENSPEALNGRLDWLGVSPQEIRTLCVSYGALV